MRPAVRRGGRSRLRELIDAHPQYARAFYNLACCESLAGRTGDAVDHLGLAIDRSDALPELVRRGDSTSIRSAKTPRSRSWSKQDVGRNGSGAEALPSA